MVVATVALLKYWPLAAAGLALAMASRTVSRLVISFSAPKEALPMGTWMMFCLSRRYSILPALASVTALPTSGGNSAGLRVGHQTTELQNLTETANAAHHVRGGDQNIEVQVAAGDLGDQIVIADLLSACSLSGLGSVALGDCDNADILAGAVGQDDSAADLLVSVTAVNAQTDVQLNGLVELSGSGLAAQPRASLGS